MNPQNTNSTEQSNGSTVPNVQPPQMSSAQSTISAGAQQLPPPGKSKKTLLFAVIILALLLVVTGFVATYFIFFNDSTSTTELNSDSEIVSSNSLTTPDTQYEIESIEIPNRGTYTLQSNVGTINYNSTIDDYMSGEDEGFVTITIPADWKVYEKNSDLSVNELGGMFIESSSGKFIHIDRVDGVGGDCMPNEVSYSLTKKILTNTPNLFFTQYNTDNHRNGILRAEYFYGDGSENGLTKHYQLNEGDSNTNECDITPYSFIGVGNLYISLSDSNVFELASNLGWDDIKDDELFIKALQSIKVTKN